MKYIVLGNSDLKVSRIALGCMSFGDPNQGMHRWTLNQEETTKIISQALDLGINFFDTALAYQNGTSEQYLARALKTLTTRDKVVLATKFLARTPEQIQQGISIKDHIFGRVHQSLE